jgi:hypothetical protein
MLKDRIPKILKYFDSQECSNVPLTDKCSKYFWLTEPKLYHNFGTVKGINYDHDEKEIHVSDTDSEDESGLMTVPEFQKSSHWYNVKRADFPQQICPICRENFEENARISVLNCHHQYHTTCISEWLTTRNSTCPTCRESSRGFQLEIIATTVLNNT